MVEYWTDSPVVESSNLSGCTNLLILCTGSSKEGPFRRENMWTSINNLLVYLERSPWGILVGFMGIAFIFTLRRLYEWRYGKIRYKSGLFEVEYIDQRSICAGSSTAEPGQKQ